MESMNLDGLGALHAEIGRLLLSIVDPGDRKILLYAEVGEGWVQPNIFLIASDTAEYVAPDPADASALGYKIIAAWQSLEPDKRWLAMEYEIEGSHFHTRFHFPGEIDTDGLPSDRHDERIKRLLGNRKVIYPPL